MKITLNVEFIEAEQLIWSLFNELPKDTKEKYSDKVSKITASLCHPSLDGDVLLPFRCGGTD